LIPTESSVDGDATSPETAPPKEAQIPPGIDPVVQGWLDDGVPKQVILDAAKEAARKHRGRVARTLETIKRGVLPEEMLQTIAGIVQEKGGQRNGGQKDPPGCSDHDPYEPGCPDCQHVLKQREQEAEETQEMAGVSKG
jgi:hypothetical protein